MKSYQRISIPKYIVLLLALAIVLSVGRIALFDSFSFIYLLWNIFLALLPFVVSALLLSYEKEKRLPHVVFIVGGFIWLLLLPNAPYMITDLIHVTEGHTVHFFYDTVLLFTSAYVGLELFLHSLSDMERVIHMRYAQVWMRLVTAGIILVTSFGICLGRFFRFNSWDVIAHPIELFKNISIIFLSPYVHTQVYILLVAFFVFLMLAYTAWKARTTYTAL
jgi:uncharacterized membrane protein